MKWQIPSDQKLEIRVWDDECIVYNESSSDTHVVDFFTVTVLSLLQEPASFDELTAKLHAELSAPAHSIPFDRIESALERLEQTELIERMNG